VFFIQDAIKFPDLVHAWKPEPHHGMPQASTAHDTFWDFASLMPETTHMLMWLMSDRALPHAYRMMDGFGVHTFRLVNARGIVHYAKFHWKAKLGCHALLAAEAQRIAGCDPDFLRRDLREAIAQECWPEWELSLQVVPEAKADSPGFDILDPTKLVPEELVPPVVAGKLVLNRNCEDFFAECEQVAFHPGHLVPGIEFSADPLLQGRLMSYTGSQIARLGGPNFAELPINRPVCPVHAFHRDGAHRYAIGKGPVSYEPNTLASGSELRIDGGRHGFQSHADDIASSKARRRPEGFDDHFSQASLFWNSQGPAQREQIVAAGHPHRRDVVHREPVAGPQPPAHRGGTEAGMPRPREARRRAPPPDRHVGAAFDVVDEGGQFPGIQRAVPVEHRHDRRRRRHHARVHRGPVPRRAFGDDISPVSPRHLRGVVGAVVVDHQRHVPRRHRRKHSRQGLRLVEARQHHRDRTVAHDPDARSAGRRARGATLTNR
jgi:hypothetical protein